MDLLATLRRSGGVSAVAVQLDESPALVDRAVEALLPLIVDAMREEVRRQGGGDAGIAGLVEMFDNEGDGSLASRLLTDQHVDPTAGHRLLDRICQAPGAAARLAAKVEVPDLAPTFLGRLAPLLTMLVGGYMSARAAGSGTEGSGGPQGIGGLYEELTR